MNAEIEPLSVGQKFVSGAIKKCMACYRVQLTPEAADHIKLTGNQAERSF